MSSDISQNTSTNSNAGLTSKTAFMNAIKQHNATLIAEANKQAATVKASAHMEAAQKLRKAHAAASAKVNASKFQYVYFLKDGVLYAKSSSRQEEAMEIEISSTLKDYISSNSYTFSCFTLDPVNNFIYAFEATAPFNLIKLQLDQQNHKLTVVRVIALNGVQALNAAWDAEGGLLYWMNANGNINTLNAENLEVNLSLLHRNTYPLIAKAHGNPFLTPDSLYGRATIFDGESSYIQLPPTTFTPNMEEGTIEACIYLNEQTKGTVFAVQDNNVNSMAILSFNYTNNSHGHVGDENGNKLFFSANNQGGRVQSKTSLKTHLWYHIAVTFRKNNITLYINGVEEDSVDYTFSIPFSSTSLVAVGAWLGDGGGVYWNGKIANFKLFNTALDAEEIATAAHSRRPLKSGVYPNSLIYQENHPEVGSVAVGPKSNYLVWSANGSVWSSGLKGRSVRKIAASEIAYLPMDVAIDDTNGDAYWIDNSNNSIFKANLSDGSIENLCSVEGIAVGLNIDPSSGAIYWTEKNREDGSSIPNLVGRWLFSKKQGNIIPDISGNGYQATIHGKGELVSSNKSGAMSEDNATALNFDGNSTYCSLPPMNVDYSEGLTLESWAHFDALKIFSRILDFGNGASADNIIMYNNGTSSDLVSATFNGATMTFMLASGVIKTNEWVHYSFSLDKNGNGKIYINGKLILSQGGLAVPRNITRKSNYFGKSNWGGNDLFLGKMAEIRIWNYPRTQEQIIENMGSLYTSELKTYNPSNKLTHSVFSLPTTRNMSLYSKGIEGYDQMLENLHKQKEAHEQAKIDLALAHKNASQKKEDAQNKYNRNVTDANSKIAGAQSDANAKRKAAQGRLTAAKNSANQSVANAQNAANAKKAEGQNQANQIKMNAQQKKRNMLDAANAKLAAANAKKAKYS